ncbi:MAG: phosphoglycolate phosphatase [Burkholderiaceae bacterium]
MICWPQIKALIFDLDGTLLDTAADLAAAANAVRTDAGLAALPEARIAGFVGRGADALIHRALTDSLDGQVDPLQFASARAGFDRHYRRENGRSARAYPGVLAGLRQIAASQYPMACVTNKPQAFAEPLLKMHSMDQFFQFVLGAEALPTRKPDPAPLLHAAQRFSLDPAHCLMIGDSVNDAAAARAAGMPVLILPYGYNEGRSVHSIDCDGIVASVEEVSAALLQDGGSFAE